MKSFIKNYKLVKHASVRRPDVWYTFQCPPDIGKMMHGKRFSCYVTDEGILYVPIEEDEKPEPAWLQ